MRARTPNRLSTSEIGRRTRMFTARNRKIRLLNCANFIIVRGYCFALSDIINSTDVQSRAESMPHCGQRKNQRYSKETPEPRRVGVTTLERNRGKTVTRVTPGRIVVPPLSETPTSK